MTELQVRRATEADIPACAAVVNGWIDATEWFPRIYSPGVIEGFLREAFSLREIWVIGAPVEGYISIDPEIGKVGALYCARSGAGLGKALLDKAKEGRARLFLHTHVTNLAAQRFYRREGFRDAGEVDPEPPETLRELRMEWRR
ncbi:GNAT family N-acetyltransferase [Alloyangia pacifica]|uniref:Acetyltransferase (GNAT) domain-containing protein n=1 Tax=Alloyangia pacifica TaxID=311180 RepID=A0A1I6S846_9RHOB|nr:GNAT family N-acetyltransferase [Alloyangia pacifica]SDG72822.1 Acetyltransferase (GNAT) domain-containing protein [Alloyangia pacifica]SFS73060.1 Acetyltransferase (GNAT) domain-containing protein [Alloyangia pacifica]